MAGPKFSVPKALPAKPSKKSNLSEEQIVDSDSEAEASKSEKPQSRSKKPKATHGKPTTNGHPSTSEDDSESDDSDESDDSSESDNSEASDSEVSESKGPTTTQLTTNGTKRKSSEVNGADTSSKSKRIRTVAEEVEKAGDGQNQVADLAIGAAPRTSELTAFAIPAGYEAVEHFVHSFDASELDGKQIWLVTAPAGLPLDTISDIAADAIKSKAPILQHNGVEYVLQEDPSATNRCESFLVPTRQGFTSTPTIHTALTVQEKVELPRLSKRQADSKSGSNAAANIGQAAVSSIRPQPEGLRMRYKPTAFGPGVPSMHDSASDESEDSGGDESDDDSDDSDEQDDLQFPQTRGAGGVATT